MYRAHHCKYFQHRFSTYSWSLMWTRGLRSSVFKIFLQKRVITFSQNLRNWDRDLVARLRRNNIDSFERQMSVLIISCDKRQRPETPINLSSDGLRKGRPECGSIGTKRRRWSTRTNVVFVLASISPNQKSSTLSI